MVLSPFTQRRASLAARLGTEGVLVLSSARESARNGDVLHPFRQDSDFYYLTGCEEPESVLVVLGGDSPRTVLFLQEKEVEREVWEGPRLGTQGALKLGVDEAYPIDELATRLPPLMMDRSQLHCRLLGASDVGVDERWLAALAGARRIGRRGRTAPSQLIDSNCVLHEMRRVKSAPEVASLSKAATISAEAHVEAMRAARPGLFEYEIEALVAKVFRAGGSDRVAYDSIVASGSMATTLHYVNNRRQMREGELLLIDAGCEYRYYAADITRTFPVNGVYSPEQREVYEIVLEAQQAAIETCRIGQTLEQVHAAAVRVISKGLIRLGVLKEALSEVLDKELYKPFYMHKTSHYLGMDVHDVGDYFEAGQPKALEEGVVITVEPGLYFPNSAPDEAERYRGIGIRIEDDLIVQAHGVLNLSEGVPKAVAEVERVCRS